MSGFRNGLLAGAAGATALNAVTYADMALRARPASSTPQRTVEALAASAGLSVPGRRGERDNRLVGLGALSGLLTGAGIGAGFGWLHQHGVRFGRVVGPVVIGGTAMAATDTSIARLGISDPRDWGPADWLADAVPHVAFGFVTHRALTAMKRDQLPHDRRATNRPSTLVRAALAGIATGGRSSAAVTALALTSADTGSQGPQSHRKRRTKLGAALLAGGELAVDKLPGTPSRATAAGSGPRGLLAAISGAAIARRVDGPVLVPAVVGVLGAAGGAFAGLSWREHGAGALGLSPLTAALIEDAVVAGVATLAVAGM